MNTAIDHCYPRRSSPFLALTRGCFEFQHTSTDNTTGVALRRLSVAPLGMLKVNSGKLVIGDPFALLQHEENVWYDVPAGEHPVFLTTAAVGEDKTLTAGQRIAYVSVVFDTQALAHRQEQQRVRLATGADPSVASEQLVEQLAELSTGSFSEAETASKLRPGIPVLSGSVALSDVESFEALMPPNLSNGQGWLERLFEHGLSGSWFDAMDQAEPWPRGCANLTLPDAPHEENIVICPTGWGDGRYAVILEWDDQQRPIALHIDFQVIPRDSMGHLHLS